MSVHVGDVGTEFILKMTNSSGDPMDVSSATALSITFKCGDASFTKEASPFTDGKDGLLIYIFAEGDLGMAGKCLAQGFARFSYGQWHSDVVSFIISENL